MAGRVAPFIDNTGLVFAYDQANIVRSYLGQPATNVITSGIPGYFGSGGETLYQQSLLGLTSDSGVFQRNYVTNPALADSGTYNNNGGLYKNFTTSALNAATRHIQISFDFYMITRYRTFSSSGTGLNGYIGITNTDSTADIYGWNTTYSNGSGDDWSNDQAYVGRWQKVSLVAALRGDKNPASINAMYIYADRFTQGEGIFTNFIITEHVSFPTGPVRYTAGTRSVTQGLKDLTGNSTIDLTNVSFDANAQMTFDGTDDFINAGNATATSMGVGDFTLETTIKPEGSAHFGVVLQKGNPGVGSNRGYRIRLENNNTVQLTVTGDAEYTATTSTITYGTYYHIAATKSSSGLKIYLNGVLSETGTSPAGTTTVSDSLVIGRQDAGNWPFNGKIAAVKIYNRALPASEIQQNFNAIKGRYGL